MMSPGAIHCSKPVQPPLPGMPPPSPLETRVFPMQLQVGDKFRDESGEWEVIAHSYATGWREEYQRACSASGHARGD
jgi:hypothetical protein